MDTITAAVTATATASPALVLVRAAKLLAVSAALFLCGINFAAAHVTRPVVSALDPPSRAAGIYHRGARAAVPFSAVSGLASALVAGLTPDRAERAPWVVASICLLAALPCARVVARETAGAWPKSAGGSDKAAARLLEDKDDDLHDGAEVSRQLRRWKRMGLFRSALAMVGGLLSLFAAVSRS